MTNKEAKKAINDLIREWDQWSKEYYGMITLKQDIEAFSCAVNALKGIEKAAKKLTWVHSQIDLYNDRPELHDEDYWMGYLTDPAWGDPDIGWEGKEE